MKILNFQVHIPWNDFANCEKKIKPAVNRMDGPKRRISKGEV